MPGEETAAGFDVIGLAQSILVPLLDILRSIINILPFSEGINYLIIALGAGYFLRGKVTPNNLLTILWLLIAGIIFLALVFVK